jgi:hypothetical protein
MSEPGTHSTLTVALIRSSHIVWPPGKLYDTGLPPVRLLYNSQPIQAHGRCSQVSNNGALATLRWWNRTAKSTRSGNSFSSSPCKHPPSSIASVSTLVFIWAQHASGQTHLEDEGEVNRDNLCEGFDDAENILRGHG